MSDDTYMVVGHALRYPHRGGTGVVACHVEDPGLRFVDDGQRFSALTYPQSTQNNCYKRLQTNIYSRGALHIDLYGAMDEFVLYVPLDASPPTQSAA